MQHGSFAAGSKEGSKKTEKQEEVTETRRAARAVSNTKSTQNREWAFFVGTQRSGLFCCILIFLQPSADRREIHARMIPSPRWRRLCSSFVRMIAVLPFVMSPGVFSGNNVSREGRSREARPYGVWEGCILT